jgi:hypothetical protein
VPQRTTEGAYIYYQQCWVFNGEEVPTMIELRPTSDVGVDTLGPLAWSPLDG